MKSQPEKNRSRSSIKNLIFSTKIHDDDFGGGKGIRVGQMEPVPVTVPSGA